MAPQPAIVSVDDRQVLAAVAAGSEEAFVQLYDRFSSLLWTVAMRILQDPAETEDVVQETFLYIWKKAGAYNPELAQPSTWMCLVLRNRCLDRLRSRHRREKLMTAVNKSNPADKEPLSDVVGDSVQLRELGQKAREVMAGIPDLQRKALELAYFSGHSHSEIALAMRLPLGTVKTMIRQGLIFLRGHMEEKWG